MYCPFCSALDTKVIDSRLVEQGARVRRRRECLCCHERFNTFETADLNLPRVIKNDGRCTSYHQEKLRRGLLRALEKRPISAATIDAAVAKIERQLRALGEREIRSQHIGELVMKALKTIDQVAYVRFASVYRSFEDVSAFQEVIHNLNQSDLAENEQE